MSIVLSLINSGKWSGYAQSEVHHGSINKLSCLYGRRTHPTPTALVVSLVEKVRRSNHSSGVQRDGSPAQVWTFPGAEDVSRGGGPVGSSDLTPETGSIDE